MDFLQYIKSFHGYWALVTITLLLILSIISIYSFLYKKDINYKVEKLSFYTTLAVHIQMLAGVAMLFMNKSLIQNLGNKIDGKIANIEHFISMLTVVLLVTIFNAKVKKSDNITTFMLVLIIVSLLMSARVFPLLISVLERI